MALLCVFPEPYVARVKVLPQDGNGGALAAVISSLGGLQNLASMLGQQGSIETYLIVGRSHSVREAVIQKLDLLKRPGYRDLHHAELKLIHKVDIHALPGGMIEVEAHDHDPVFARKLVQAYADAFHARLSELNHEQTEQKRAFVLAKVDESWARLRGAEKALTDFQSANKLASPETELGAAVAMKTGLQAQLQAKMVELQTAQQFATEDNMTIRAIRSEIGSLQSQIGQTERQSTGIGSTGAPNLAGMADKAPEYLNLYRQFRYAESLYQVYNSFLEEVNVEEVTNRSNMELVEPAFIDPGRHFNLPAVGLLLAMLMLAFYTEYYVPMTGIGRKKSDRFRLAEQLLKGSPAPAVAPATAPQPTVDPVRAPDPDLDDRSTSPRRGRRIA